MVSSILGFKRKKKTGWESMLSILVRSPKHRKDRIPKSSRAYRNAVKCIIKPIIIHEKESQCYNQSANQLPLSNNLLFRPVVIENLPLSMRLCKFPSAVENQCIFQQNEHTTPDHTSSPSGLKQTRSASLQDRGRRGP